MKNNKNYNLKICLLLVTALCIFEIKSQETFTLNYLNADLAVVTQDIAKFANKTLILDPRVKGRVTIFSDSILTSDQVWSVYLRTIQAQGFTSVRDGNIIRIVPENEATRDKNQGNNSADMTTKVITLKNRSASEILTQIKPITGRQSHLSSIPSINSILLVDKRSNIERIERLVQTLDKVNSAEITIIKLENLSSIEAVRILERLKAQNNPTINNFIAVPFTASNSVILSADSAVTNNISKTLRTLDQDSLSEGSINVIYLKYSKADEVAAIISSVSSRFSSEDSSKPVVTSHRETNSLIISAEETTIDAIRNLVAKLDIRRAQVLVEAIIVELSETAAKSLGVETIFQGSEGSDVPIGITRFADGGPDLLAIAGSQIEPSNATFSSSGTTSLLNTQGLIAGLGDFGGDDNFVGIIRAISDDKNSNILSTPSIIAMDNEPANLVIGQEIPITTGESLGTSNANPFRTTSRQEVGIKLSVTPQINEGNSVILDIKQEVSAVAGPLTGTTDLITNKRSIETTVLVDNNQIIVLGGLIDDDLQEDISSVPILGSIPVIGKIFSSSAKSRVQRNLMVFLRPTILTDTNDISSLSNKKYNFIQAEKLLRDPESRPLIDLSKE